MNFTKNIKKKSIESIVIYGRGKKYLEKNVHKISSNLLAKINKAIAYISGYEYGGANLSTYRLLKIIKKEKPDIVHIHCINGNSFNIYKIINFLKLNKINTVITNHAEFFYTGSYSYVPENSNQWLTGEKETIKNAKKLSRSLLFNKTHKSILKMKKSFSGFDHCIITSVSPWITERASRSFVLKDFKHQTVLNGINLEIFKYTEDIQFTKRFKSNGEKILLHVTSGLNDPVKGGQFFNRSR